MGWFRAYDEAVYDQKLLSIADDLEMDFLFIYGAWMATLALANMSPERGRLLISSTRIHRSRNVSVAFHCTEHQLFSVYEAFVREGLLHIGEMGEWVVSNWQKRQFQSDSSTNRTRKHRSRNVAGTSQERCGNGPETETETETDMKGEYENPTDEMSKALFTVEDTNPIESMNPFLEVFTVLKSIKGYPFDANKDTEMLVRIHARYPHVDLLEVANDMAVWLLGKPITEKANPRGRFNTFVKNAAERPARSGGNGSRPAAAESHPRPASATPNADAEWKKIEEEDEILKAEWEAGRKQTASPATDC